MNLDNITEAAGYIAYSFSQVQPYLLPFFYLTVSAVIPLWTGAHASLVRPSSSRKPNKSSKLRPWHDDEGDQEEKHVQLEGFAPVDAILFPLAAGIMLTILYYAFNYLDPATINKIVNGYVSVSGFFAVTNAILDTIAVMHSLIFPSFYVYRGQLYKFSTTDHRAVSVAGLSGQRDIMTRSSPFPGVLSSIPLPSSLSRVCWFFREIPIRKWEITSYVHGIGTLNMKFHLFQVFAVLLSLSGWVYWNIIDKPWWLGNLAGYASAYTGIEYVVPNSFLTGTEVLAGLFIYDIVMVFYTPMMLKVATSVDAPLMLRIPKSPGSKSRGFSILGLGDIVVPGMMLALALRFDQWIYYLRKQTSLETDDQKTTTTVKAPYVPLAGHWGNRFWIWLASKGTPPWSDSKSFANRSALMKAWSEETSFPKRYFNAGIAGYSIGLTITQIVVQKFQRGQPALLYLVPCVLGALWGTGLFRGELQYLWAYTDEAEVPQLAEAEVQNENNQQTKSWSDWFSESFFSMEKSERNARRLGLSDDVGKDKATEFPRTNEIVYFALKSPYTEEHPRQNTPRDDHKQSFDDTEPAGKRQKLA